MIKKKVLVHGLLKSLQDFFSSPFSVEFAPLSVVSDDADKFVAEIRKGGGTAPEVFAVDNFPRFVLPLIDGIVLTDFDSRTEMINRLLQMGVEPRKIILWSNRGEIEPFKIDESDGTTYLFMEGLQFHIRNEEDLIFFHSMRGIFQNQRQFYTVNPQYYPQLVAQQYQNIFGKSLNLDNPQTWTEKMQWLKLLDVTPLKTRLADKYLVRQWIAEKIGEQYLIPLLGVWDNFDEIDFDALPNQFVLKCNHGSGMNIICRDKKDFDFEAAREKLTAWLNIDYGTLYFELQYSGIPRKIIAEKFMTDGKNLDLIDYKFLCFDGKPYYCQYMTNRSFGMLCDYFDLDWNHLDFERADHIRNTAIKDFSKPKNFELMKQLATELCKGFSFVRVDFYEVGDKVYFGEMTFTPAAGWIKYNSEGTDAHFGKLMTLPTLPLASKVAQSQSVRRKILPVQNILPRKTPPISQRVIASLTSWSKRISTVHLAVQTILAQTRQPNLTVLYLGDSEFPNREDDLPKELTALLSDRFEIRWTKDIRSFTKLIPALKDFPDDVIVTFDDDIFYDKRLLEILLDEYVKNPQYIHCHRSTSIGFNNAGEIELSRIPYDNPTYLHKFTSVGSVLYPVHCFSDEVFNEKNFTTLSPFQDDVWFWLMGVLNGHKVNVVKNNLPTLNYIEGTQEVGLYRINDYGEKLFFVQLQNVLDAYPILKDVLESEWRRVVK